MKLMPLAPFMHGAAHWMAFNAFGGGNTIVLPRVVEHLDPTDAHHTTGSVQTFGTDAYGVLAQSVGGGGGLVVGGSNPQGALAKLYSGGNLNGDGGSVSVTVNNGFSMGTAGTGAIGVLAQSIGGGGGVIGGMSQVDVTQPIQATPREETGQGGNVSVDLESGGNVSTSGTRAHVIVAQSLGGGGGVLERLELQPQESHHPQQQQAVDGHQDDQDLAAPGLGRRRRVSVALGVALLVLRVAHMTLGWSNPCA